MKQRKPTGVLVVTTRCKSPAKEAEFNRWYTEVHIPDVIATGAFYAATRYENPNAKPGEAKYLAIYETDWEDPMAAYTEVGKHSKKMQLSPELELLSAMPYQRIR